MADERGPIKGSGSSSYGATDDNASVGKSTAVPEQIEVVHDHDNLHGWRKIKYQFREYFAEFLGTFTLVGFGLGGIAQAVLSEFLSDSPKGNWLTIALSFGFGLALAITVSGNISGGHLNPAVTITLAVFRRFSWLKVPGYIVAQTIGAFVAAAIVFANYNVAISKFDGGHRHVTGQNATAGIFATYPVGFLTTPGAFFSEALGTFFLLLVILAVTDERNTPTSKFAAPFTIGLALTTIALAGGWETGFSLNPARDFGPRLFTFVAGYGVEVFSAAKLYFWIPLVAPIVGGLVAGFVYDGLIYT
ncbi:8035_t:CDS:2, partial [Ambispora leptoticha]